MKKLLFFTLFNLCLCSKLFSQNITIIPNLDTTDVGVMGYISYKDGLDNLVSYNGNLYFPYQFSGIYPNPYNRKCRLAKYNDTIIRVFNNVNNADTGFTGYPIVYRNNLYFQYKNSAGKFQLAKFNDVDTVINLIPNLQPADIGYTGYPFVFNNNLYFQYKNSLGNFQMAKWNDTSLLLIPNLASNQLGYVGNPIAYNNNLYFSYQDSTYPSREKLARLSDTAITIFKSFWYKGEGVIYRNKLFFSGSSGSYIQGALLCLNSIDSIGKIDTTCFFGSGVPSWSYFLAGKLKVCNNNLYGVSSHHNMSQQYSNIIKFNGTNFTKVNLPTGVIADPPYDVLIKGSYQNSLYIYVPGYTLNFRLEDTTVHTMNGSIGGTFSNFDTAIIATKDVVTNQDILILNGGIGNIPYVFIVKLKPDNDTLIGITNNNTKVVAYYSSLRLHKNIVYFVGTTNSGAYQLMKLENITLPLNFIDYNVVYSKQQVVKNIWTTANEINVSHFNIQRSINGNDFITIGQQNAKNKSTNEYIFEDENLPIKNNFIYYRIAAVDKDGKINYSETKKIAINNSSSNINIYPNPAKDMINIDCDNASQIIILDGYGRIVKQVNNVSEHQTINLKQFNKGVYFIKIVLKNLEIKTEKIIVQ